MKKIFSVMMIMFLLVLSTSCTKNENGLIEKGKLYVSTSSDYAPFEFVDLTKEGQERFVGSDMALARYIAAELGLELEIKSMGFKTVLTGIDSNKVDISISGLTYDEERANNYLFSNTYYEEGEGSQCLLINKSHLDTFKKLSDFDDKNIKIAAQSGSLQADLVKEQLPNATLVLIDDLTQASTLLENGTYDAIAMAQTPAETIASNNSSLSLAIPMFESADSSYFIIAKKGNTILMDQINEIIKKVNEKSMYKTWVSEAKALFEKLGDNAGELVPENE